jgi:ADP-heptose:LPS heptosyltransferase
MNLDSKRILIVKPSSLGDIIHTLPLVHAIKRRYPSTYTGWIIQRNFAAVIEHDPSVDEVIPIHIPSTSDPNARRGVLFEALGATLSTIKHLRALFSRAPYDLVLDLHASFRSALLGRCNPNGLRMGFADAKELNTWFQGKLVKPDPQRPHAIDKNLEFLKLLNISPLDEDFHLAPGEAAAKEAREFLAHSGISGEQPIIYANPAARWVTKQWSIQQWAQLGDALMERNNAAFILSGAAGDLPHIEKIAHMMRHKPIISAGKLSLAAAMELAGLSDVYVGVDSGPMHFSAMAGAPVVALFGPTDPRLVGPYGRGHKVITNNNMDCLACRKRSCEHMDCLNKIGWEEVYSAVLEKTLLP